LLGSAVVIASEAPAHAEVGPMVLWTATPAPASNDVAIINLTTVDAVAPQTVYLFEQALPSLASNFVAQCSVSQTVQTCSWGFARSAGTYIYTASTSFTFFGGVVSNPVAVTWGVPPASSGTGPSSSCDAGLSLADFTVLTGVHVKAYALVNSSAVLVCFRVDASTLAHVGGVVGVLIGDPDLGLGGVGVPTVDGNSLACQSAPGNVNVFNGTVGSVPVRVDVTPGSAEKWVCLNVGTVHQRIVVPVGTPSPSLDPGITPVIALDPL
jgi:hypothetical protein